MRKNIDQKNSKLRTLSTQYNLLYLRGADLIYREREGKWKTSNISFSVTVHLGIHSLVRTQKRFGKFYVCTKWQILNSERSQEFLLFTYVKFLLEFSNTFTVLVQL